MFKFIIQKNLNLRPTVNIKSLFTDKKFFFSNLLNLKCCGSFKNGKSIFPNNTLNFSEPKSNVLIRYQKFGMRSMKSKRKLRMPNTKYKIKNHQGLMKRIRIVGPVWNRGFKFWPTGNVHKMTNKSNSNLKRKRQARYIHQSDLRRVKRLIPMFKRQKFKH